MAEVDPWLDTSGDPGVQNFSCVVGDKIKICHSNFYRGISFTDTSDTRYLLKGYRVVYKNIGELEDSDEWNCVVYKHLKSGRQIIEFTEDVAFRKSYFVMQGVVVHDHASIPTGGPAYATYYSEPNLPTTEEGG